jgi:hypothetical protein
LAETIRPRGNREVTDKQFNHYRHAGIIATSSVVPRAVANLRTSVSIFYWLLMALLGAADLD